MEAQAQAAPGSLVKISLRLGSETHSVTSNEGILSEQLVSAKEQSMSIFKEYITRHNVRNDVPDELAESSSEDDADINEKPHVKSKKTKIN
ncbi:uncharacterized protein LOC116209878 [Punica granatum]|uniref:Uncharacterized protein n=2 Tax=Punica granatum TaxID=22663 RepID=A0A2I0IJE1_PUNGR|nr:uncharacterized protein LOC116209878 [Punica granatum]PKI44104.1 hypothetical protein CRG98_035516 [Punica granatum]